MIQPINVVDDLITASQFLHSAKFMGSKINFFTKEELTKLQSIIADFAILVDIATRRNPISRKRGEN